jgi:hypothetical protein
MPPGPAMAHAKGEFIVMTTFTRLIIPYNSQTYLGYGTGTADLSCVNTDQITPNWTLGEIYQYETTTCTGPDLIIYPTVIQE